MTLLIIGIGFLFLQIYFRVFKDCKTYQEILTRDKVAWCWGDAETNICMALKVVMATSPVLRMHDSER